MKSMLQCLQHIFTAVSALERCYSPANGAYSLAHAKIWRSSTPVDAEGQDLKTQKHKIHKRQSWAKFLQVYCWSLFVFCCKTTTFLPIAAHRALYVYSGGLGCAWMETVMKSLPHYPVVLIINLSLYFRNVSQKGKKLIFLHFSEYRAQDISQKQ